MRTPPPPSPALAVNALSLGIDAFLAVTAAVHSGLANQRASFECVLEGDAAFHVLAGVEPLLDGLERFRLKTDELAYLEGVGAIDATVMGRLMEARFTCDVDAAPEGSIVFSGEPVLIVEGPFWQAQLVEAWVRSSIDAATQVATHFARCALVAEEAEVIETGTTLVNRLGGNPLLARAAYVGGSGASTNALAGRRYGVPVRARQPASYVLASKSETAALEGWLKATTDQPVLRVDVREAIAGIDRAVAAARSRATASWSDAPIVIELSADVIVEAAPIAAEKFAKAGLKEPVLVVYGADTPARLAELRASGAPIAAYVVECPAITPKGARFDVVAVEEGGQWAPRMRLAPTASCSTVPGRVPWLERAASRGEGREALRRAHRLHHAPGRRGDERAAAREDDARRKAHERHGARARVARARDSRRTRAVAAPAPDHGARGVPVWHHSGTRRHARRAGREASRALTVQRARATTRIEIPCLGRIVTAGSSTSSNPGESSRRHRCATVASTTAISMSANWLPMQVRGPPPNGRYAYRGRSFSFSGRKRSGSKPSGLSQ